MSTKVDISGLDIGVLLRTGYVRASCPHGCHCSCHGSSFIKHFFACCCKCSICQSNIDMGQMENHLRDCHKQIKK